MLFDNIAAIVREYGYSGLIDKMPRVNIPAKNYLKPNPIKYKRIVCNKPVVTIKPIKSIKPVVLKKKAKGRRHGSKNLIWRYLVLFRDRNRCTECGIAGVRLAAHHIKEYSKYPELRFEVSNGQTLCYSCHHKKHPKLGSYLFRVN